MISAGPDIHHLTHRLMTAPSAVGETPESIGKSIITSTAVIVSDLIHDLGGKLFILEEAGRFQFKDLDSRENLLRMIQLAAWVLADPWFVSFSRDHKKADIPRQVHHFLFAGLAECALVTQWNYFLEDPEGREELCRRILATLDIIPAGETEARAADRLRSLDSVERARVVRDMREAERRAREIREAMARREAEEAASKMTRE